MKNYDLYKVWPGYYAVMAPYFLAWVEEIDTKPKATEVDEFGQLTWSNGREVQIIFEEQELMCYQFFETVDAAAEFVVELFNGDGEKLKLDLSR